MLFVLFSRLPVFKPGGGLQKVTQENKAAYVQAYGEFRTENCVMLAPCYVL